MKKNIYTGKIEIRAEDLERKNELLLIAAQLIRANCPDAAIEYDGLHRDGERLAQDCEYAAGL